MNAPAKPIGRPSSYTDEKADEICSQLACGKSLSEICAQDDMPHMATVFRWLAANEGFSESYARARETQADTLFDEVLAIADDKRNSQSQDALRAAVLRVDARKWIAGKLRPKKYGDRLDVAGDIAVNVTVRRFDGQEAETTAHLIEHQAVSEPKPLKSLAPVRIIDPEQPESAAQQSDKPDRSIE